MPETLPYARTFANLTIPGPYKMAHLRHCRLVRSRKEQRNFLKGMGSSVRDPEQTFPCGDTDGALFAQQALTPAQADAQECS